MGHIRTKTLGTGKKAYLARWIDPATGKERTKQFSLKKDAQYHIDRVEGAKAEGLYIDPARAEITVREYFDSWYATLMTRDLTKVNVKSNMENHVLPLIGHRKLATIRRSDVQGIVAACKEKGLKGSTIKVVMDKVKALFKAAVLDRRLPSTPYVNIQLPDRTVGKVVIPTVKQIRAVAAALPERYKAMPIIAAGTGLRVSELTGLQVDAIDFDARTLTVPERDAQLAYYDGRTEPHLAPPKTKASARTVPLSDTVIAAIQVHLDAGHDGKVNLPDQDGNPGMRHMMFVSPTGKAFIRNSAGRIMRLATAGMNLPPRASWHWFRHFYASALIAAGEDPKTIQGRMGHGSITETFDTYGHLFPDTEDRSRRAIDDAFGEDDES